MLCVLSKAIGTLNLERDVAVGCRFSMALGALQKNIHSPPLILEWRQKSHRRIVRFPSRLHLRVLKINAILMLRQQRE